MTPVDPRHRSVAGYRAGCRLPCCRNAIRRYNQARKLAGAQPSLRLVDATGTRRRLRALVALGWSFPQLAAHTAATGTPIDKSYLRVLARIPKSTVTDITEARIIELYDLMSMSLPPQDTPGQRQSVTRSQRFAAQRRWLPPLALDDDLIDNPDYRPTKGIRQAELNELRAAGVRFDYDHALVERVVAGQPRPRGLTSSEAAEVCRRLQALGYSNSDIEKRWALKPERYPTQTPAAVDSTPATAGTRPAADAEGEAARQPATTTVHHQAGDTAA